MDTNFSSILNKFKEGANSMEEVYNELSHLTSNYDEELDKLQKQLTELTLIAENEEEKRHEAENNLADLKKLQQINFSTIVDELIRKPREDMEYELKKSTKKFLSTAMLTTVISVVIITIFAFFAFFFKDNVNTNLTSNNNEYKILIKKIDALENTIKTLKASSKTEIIKKESIKKENIIEPTVTREDITKEKTSISTDDKEKILEKIALHIKSFDSQFRLNTKNRTRLLYKMNLLDFAPIKYEDIIQEIELFARKDTYIPTIGDLEVWDKQMLEIYKKMLSKLENISENNISEQMTVFENYKSNDATYYGNWQYSGQKNISLKESLIKEIIRVEAQIELNSF